MDISVTYAWLIAGVALIAAEAIGISGIGLLFAGLGAIVTGAAIYLGWAADEAHVMQGVIFFAASAVWALLLWKPLQKFRMGKHGGGYSNIVGETAYVGSQGLSKQKGGEVTWSGTIMKAQLVKNAHADKLEAGSQVTVVDVQGATLVVKPRE